MSDKQTKKSWKQRVLEFLNGGDDANVTAFEIEFVRHLQAQVKKATKNIENIKSNLEDELFEAETVLTELKEIEALAYVSIDADAIKTMEARTAYRVVFQKQIEDAATAVKSCENKIANLKAQAELHIAQNEKIITAYKLQIEKLS